MLYKTIRYGILIVVPSLLLTCVLTMLLNRSSGRIVHSWSQPEEIDYKSHGPYTLFVREKAPDWYLFGGRMPRYEIFIGHDDSYGHWFDCTFHSDIHASTVEWTEEGVSIKQESGHVIFFPKKTFIGGR